MFEEGETVEFGGKIIAQMAANPKIMNHTARVVAAADYAEQYGIKDIDGRAIPTHRELKNMVSFLPKNLRSCAESKPTLKVPQVLLTVANSKYFKF